MNRTFKTIVTICIACALIISLSIIAFAEPIEQKNQTIPMRQFVASTISSKYNGYIPFIYKTPDVFYLEDTVLVSGESYLPNSVYLLNSSTKTVELLLETSARNIAFCDTDVYCITSENTITRINLDTREVDEVYSAVGTHISYLEVSNYDICFAQDDTVKLLDKATGTVYDLAQCEGISFLYPLTTHRFAWMDADGNTWEHDIDTGKNTLIDFDFLFLGESTIALTSASASQSLPFSEYPVGSYFSNNGRACTHHGQGCDTAYGTCGCKSFANSIQCMGFARYAFAHYVGRSTWDSTGHAKGTLSYPNEEEVKALIQSLDAGAYLRLTSVNKDSNGNFIEHSFVVLRSNSNNVTVYEANFSGPCKVGMRTLTYKQLKDQYFKITESYSHNLAYREHNATYHKVVCKISGCGGYRLEEHYAVIPGSNATCAACGYVGSISIGTQSGLPSYE